MPDPAFLALAATAIASPGPSVWMTVAAAGSSGLRAAWAGILGVAAASAMVAMVSAGGLGLLIARSGSAMVVLELAGAGYLFWRGWLAWHTPPTRTAAAAVVHGSALHRFVQGLAMQLANPKALVFFLAVLPPFLRQAGAAGPGALAHALSYAVLVIVIHGSYALLASRARVLLQSPRAARAIARASGAMFMLLALFLAFGSVLPSVGPAGSPPSSTAAT